MSKRKTEKKSAPKGGKRLIKNEDISSPQISDESEPDDRHYKKRNVVIDVEKERRSKIDHYTVPLSQIVERPKKIVEFEQVQHQELITTLPANLYGEFDDDYNDDNTESYPNEVQDYSHLDAKRENINEFSIQNINRRMEMEYVDHNKEIIFQQSSEPIEEQIPEDMPTIKFSKSSQGDLRMKTFSEIIITKEVPIDPIQKDITTATIKKNQYDGQKFCILGTLEKITRPQLIKHIQELGGKVENYKFLDMKKNVILIIGMGGKETKDYKDIKKKNYDTKEFCEDEILEIIGINIVEGVETKKLTKELVNQPEDQQKVNEIFPNTQQPFFNITSTQNRLPAINHMLQQNKRLESQKIESETLNKKVDGRVQNQNNLVPQITNIKTNNAKGQLWTQKYCPTSFSECLFNEEMSKKLALWLKQWSVNTEQSEFRQQFPSQNLSARAALISGPPGIGKTTTARIVARHLGYNVLEWNASDVRSRLSIEEGVKHLADNRTIRQAQVKGLDMDMSAQTLIIMDEIDGMTGSDRGGCQLMSHFKGITSVIDLIKKTQVPIICICNDRYSQKIKSLVNHCLDLKFVKPDEKSVCAMLEQVCRKEDIPFDHKSLLNKVEQSRCDIRQLLTILQVSRISNKRSDIQKLGEKDQSVTTNVFEATKQLLNYNEEQTYSKGMELYFIDHEIIPLMYYQNYLGAQKSIKLIEQAAVAIADADVFTRKVRRGNEWSLLPQCALLSTLYPTQKLKCVFKRKVEFTALLGKMSSMRKQDRILMELKNSLSQQSLNSSTQSIKYGYLQTLIQSFQCRIQNSQIDKAIELLSTYNLTLNDMNSNIMDMLAFFPQRLALKTLDANTKMKITKAYNKRQDSSKADGNKRKGVQQDTNKETYNENIEEVIKDENTSESEQSVEQKGRHKDISKKKKNLRRKLK